VRARVHYQQARRGRASVPGSRRFKNSTFIRTRSTTRRWALFSELIRKFNEALNDNPGEHFTPRDVVHLMVDLMLAGDSDRIRRKVAVLTVYDPCCGSGGMLMITKEQVTIGLRKNGNPLRPPLNKDAGIHLFGQEVNPETLSAFRSLPERHPVLGPRFELGWRGISSGITGAGSSGTSSIYSPRFPRRIDPKPARVPFLGYRPENVGA
jgi:hypothetical protein